MNSHKPLFQRCLMASFGLFILLLSSCSQSPKSCQPQATTDLSGLIASAEDDQLLFRFPLDEPGNDVRPFPAIFCMSGGTGSAREYHAAEDYHLPAGTPVYAVTDGILSFSGPMRGYGWLIIIDHPQANMYSLYGHLSPSRWRLKSGPVEKGELIAYLGDADENGGSPTRPLNPHLHFGMRAGQRTDYPGMGEWRWQAGWIKPCPKDLGWLQPSGVLTGQEIPPGGFPDQAAGLLEKWVVELTFMGIYSFSAVAVLVLAIKRNKPIVLVPYGVLISVAGWILFSKGTRLSYVLFAIAGLMFILAIFFFTRSPEQRLPANRSR